MSLYKLTICACVYSQPDDMVASALKAFYSDPEIYYLVVDSISQLITVGTDQLGSNKRFVQDIWSLIHIFAKHLKPTRTHSKCTLLDSYDPSCLALSTCR